MKTVIFLIVSISAFVACYGDESCPPNEHAMPDCPQYHEPECGNPTAHPLKGKMARICPVPVCFCNEPLVRNFDTGKCVPVSECP